MLIFILAPEEHWGENQPPLHKSGAFLSGHLFAAVSDPARAGGGVCVCVCWWKIDVSPAVVRVGTITLLKVGSVDRKSWKL